MFISTLFFFISPQPSLPRLPSFLPIEAKMISYRMVAVAGFLASVGAVPLNINLGAYSPALYVLAKHHPELTFEDQLTIIQGGR